MMVPCHVTMTASTQREVVVLRGPRSLARCAADWLLGRALAVEEAPAICLAGGSTPQSLYRLLAEPPYRDRFPWQRVHWFWGDERFVPRDHPRSNYRMVKEALFDRVPVPPQNIHPFDTMATLEVAAASYERELKSFYGATELRPDRPLFAATLLGLGGDGHTASLFPGQAALDEHKAWVAAVPEGQPEPRLTLTYPTLDSSGEIAFLVSGAAKRDILRRVRNGEDFPATRVDTPGRIRWFVDRAAVGAA